MIIISSNTEQFYNMKFPIIKYIIFTIISIPIAGFVVLHENKDAVSAQKAWRGEKMLYKVHYGFINAGEALIHVDNKIHTLNAKKCYKIDVDGYTTGFFDMVLRVKDVWGSYMDTSDLISHRSYRYIEEGKYSRYEIVDFDHEQNAAHLYLYEDATAQKVIKKDTFNIPDNIQDLVSGYYLLRTFDFSKFKPNQLFQLTGFFEDSTYTIDVKYLGIQQLKTKIGKMQAHVISPIVPENSLFRGDNPVKAWISADDRKIPLKIEAELLVGALAVSILDFKEGEYP